MKKINGIFGSSVVNLNVHEGDYYKHLRDQAAVEAMSSLLINKGELDGEHCAKLAADYADKLVEELKNRK